MLLAYLSLTFMLECQGQILDPTRSVDWTLAGLNDTTTMDFVHVDMLDWGLANDSSLSVDSIVSVVLDSVSDSGAVLHFSDGNFLFNKPLHLNSNVILKGAGVDVTTFIFDLGGSDHSINIQGSINNIDTSFLSMPALKDSNEIIVKDSIGLSAGDWVQIFQDDTDLVTSAWAEKTVGQIVRIEAVNDSSILLVSPLRMEYDTIRNPYLLRIDPIQNVGIECLKIIRQDDTAPQQSSNINFHRAVNSWVRGVESDRATFSHVQARQSSNINISHSYFHHAFEYGGGGRAYGVMLHSTSNECLVEHNVFEHLRHSMILQSGANGNVFAYNYSFDPFWESLPSDAAGDMVLHGNYPYANLFEQNICRNIVIDNSHGPNGPNNTIFRNRSEGFGIFFSADNSPGQNIIGNEIPNLNFPYNIANYTIQGDDHFLYGNNDKGNIVPDGTEGLIDSSYAYIEKPSEIRPQDWSGIGTPNVMESNSIYAKDAFLDVVLFSNSCDIISKIDPVAEPNKFSKVKIFPNPTHDAFGFQSEKSIKVIQVFNSRGQQQLLLKDIGLSETITTSHWQDGCYFILFVFEDDTLQMSRLIKQ